MSPAGFEPTIRGEIKLMIYLVNCSWNLGTYQQNCTKERGKDPWRMVAAVGKVDSYKAVCETKHRALSRISGGRIETALHVNWHTFDGAASRGAQKL